jgi:CheY-like chemotaxis protein
MIGPRLLYVEDDARVRKLYQQLLTNLGYSVVVARDGHQALQLFDPASTDAVLVDYQLPDMNGGQIAAELKRRCPTVPVIMVSGCEPILQEAPHFVDAAVAKGAPVQELADQIELLLANRRTMVEVGASEPGVRSNRLWPQSSWLPMLF